MKRITIFFISAVVVGLLWEYKYLVDHECVPTPTISPRQERNNTCFKHCKDVNPPCVCPTFSPHAPCPSQPSCPLESNTCPPSPSCITSTCPPCMPCSDESKDSDYPAGFWSAKRTFPRLIIDAFTFEYGLDWLELRMNELNDVVDYFIIMEGQLTSSNKSKPMFYLNNKDKYAHFADKISYVDCSALNSSDHFGIETSSRKCLQVGVGLVLQKLKEKEITYSNSDLIIMTSDLDELPRANMVKKWKWFDPMPALPAAVECRFFYYNFHWQIMNVLWDGTVVINYQLMLDYPNTTWRGPNNRVNGSDSRVQTKFKNGGWHCSNCLSVENLQYKIKNFADIELDTPQSIDLVHLNDSIQNGKDWTFKDIYNFQPTNHLGDIPKYLLKDMDKFANLIPLSKYEKVKVLEESLKYHDGSELWSYTLA